MRHEINETSYVWLSDSHVKLLLRAPVNLMVISWFIIAFGILVLFVVLFNLGINFLVIFPLGFIFLGITVFNYKREVNINLQQRTFGCINSLYDFNFNTTSFDWDEDSFFYYEVRYDNYEGISSIVLFARFSNRPYERKRMLKFYDPATFFKFQKLFNKKNPGFQIQEWYA